MKSILPYFILLLFSTNLLATPFRPPCEITGITMDPANPEPICDDEGIYGLPGSFYIFLRVDGITQENVPYSPDYGIDYEKFLAIIDGREYYIYDVGFNTYNGEEYFSVKVSDIPGDGQTNVSVELILEEDCSWYAPDLFDAPACHKEPCEITGLSVDPNYSFARCNDDVSFTPLGTHSISVKVEGITPENQPVRSDKYIAIVGGIEYKYPYVNGGINIYKSEEYFYVTISGIPSNGQTNQPVEIILEEGCSYFVPDFYDAPTCTNPLWLIDGKTKAIISPVENGGVLDQASLPFKPNFQFDPNAFEPLNGIIDSVSFSWYFNGLIKYYHTERNAPFLLFGNRVPQSYGIPQYPYPPKGEYLIVMRAYRGNKTVGLRRSHFTVTGPEPSISGIFLVDAAADHDIRQLHNNDILFQDQLPSLLNFRAETANEDVKSVVLELSGMQTTSSLENTQPYSLFGNRNGNFFGKALAPGGYTLTATPYPLRNGFGEPGPSVSLWFVVKCAPLNLREDVNSFGPPTWVAYPNPTSGPITIVLPDRGPGENISLWLTDLLGRKVSPLMEVNPDQHSISIDREGLGLSTGTYILQALGAKEKLPGLRILWQ